MTDWRVLKVRCEGPLPTALPDLPRPLLLVFPASAEGEELAGAIAAESGAATVGRITSLQRDDDNLVVSRTSHGGRVAISLRIREGLAVATANDMPEGDGEIALGAPAGLACEQIPLSDQRVSLESARIVIAGG